MQIARRKENCFKNRILNYFQTVSLSFCFAFIFAIPIESFAEPLVAIHVSEITQALETTPAKAPTPTGPGLSGYEWFYTSWHYFVAYESLKEALRSDGTPFVEVSDADIAAGKLLYPEGSPRFPILISLASEAISSAEIAPLRDYVNAGGFLLVGSSAFTRNPDGTTRGDFALANEMGLSMTIPNLQNWYQNKQFTKLVDHRLVSHIPSGTLTWNMPLTSEEIPWGVSPEHNVHGNHYVWHVRANDAEVIANGILGPLLTIKNYGRGYFIYHAAMQPLIAHGNNDSSMYSYMIYRNAIEWAFESANTPIVRLSPWPYSYDAAFIIRHDLENSWDYIQRIESSAQFEHSVGAKGDYYFCTGTLREEVGNSAPVIASLRRAVSNYGATVGSHNGGLKNPVNTSLSYADYDYWHWGPDEALDTTQQGYPDGKTYALTSLSLSFQDIEGWLAGIDNGRPGCGTAKNCPRIWVSPAFNSTREDSKDILQQLYVETAGEQKLIPFPHYTLSYKTPGKFFSHITLPPSDWYVGTSIAQRLELQTMDSIHKAVDFYYDLGAFLNFYGHEPSDNGSVQQEYMMYSLFKPRMWSTNSVEIADWWRLRSNTVVIPVHSMEGNDSVARATITGATHSSTSVEIAMPNWDRGAVGYLQVFLNSIPADPADYRATNQGVKIRVGETTSRIEVRYSRVSLAAINDAFSTAEDVTLTVSAPGVLGNDTDPDGNSLTAILVAGTAHGIVTLNSNGSFTYIPAINYSGTDSFTYRASDGSSTSNIATVTIQVKSGAITVASVSSGKIDSGSCLTISHTTSGSDRLMLVGISLRPGVNNYSVSGITYNGTVLTKAGSVVRSDRAKVEIWRLIAPPTGTSNVVIAFNSSVTSGAVAGVMTFTGVNQNAPLGTFVSATGSSGTASVNVASAAGEVVFGVVDAYTSGSLTQGASQTEHWDLSAYSGNSHGAGSTQSGGASVSASWKLGSSADWAVAAVPIKPASVTTTYTITATAGTGGSITPSGSLTVTSGGSQTFTIAANTGYSIADVKVDGVSVGAVSTYTFSNVTANHTIAVTFVAATYPKIYVDPSSLDFGNVKVGSKKSKNLKVTNIGKANLIVTKVEITGTSSASFSSDFAGTKTVSPLNFFQIRVAFKPTSKGSETATLTITSNDPDTPVFSVPLSGSGHK